MGEAMKEAPYWVRVNILREAWQEQPRDPTSVVATLVVVRSPCGRQVAAMHILQSVLYSVHIQ